MPEVESMSYNDFCERFENRIVGHDFLAAFSMHCLGYWLQQNRDKVGDKEYAKLEVMYENPIA